MTFVAFIIWVLIVAVTGYMLWKLVFEGRVCKKEEPEPMAVKTGKPDSESPEEEKPGEFRSDVVEAQEEPPLDDDESPEELEVIEGEAEEFDAEKIPEPREEEEVAEKPEKEK